MALGRRSLFIGATALPLAMLPAPTGARRIGLDLVLANQRLIEVIAQQRVELDRLKALALDLTAAVQRLPLQVRWASNDADMAANDTDPMEMA